VVIDGRGGTRGPALMTTREARAALDVGANHQRGRRSRRGPPTGPAVPWVPRPNASPVRFEDGSILIVTSGKLTYKKRTVRVSSRAGWKSSCGVSTGLARRFPLHTRPRPSTEVAWTRGRCPHRRLGPPEGAVSQAALDGGFQTFEGGWRIEHTGAVDRRGMDNVDPFSGVQIWRALVQPGGLHVCSDRMCSKTAPCNGRLLGGPRRLCGQRPLVHATSVLGRGLVCQGEAAC